MALVKKSTLPLKSTVNPKITKTDVAKPTTVKSTPIKKMSVNPKTSSSEGITTVKSTSTLKSTLQSTVPSASTKMTAKQAVTPRPTKTTTPVKQAADSTSTLKVKSAVKPAGRTPSVPVKPGVVAKATLKTLKITAPTSPVKKAAVPAAKSVKVASQESVSLATKPAITTKVSTLKSSTPSSTTPVKTRSTSITLSTTPVKTRSTSITLSTAPVKTRSMSITSVKSSTATKTTKPVAASKNSISTAVKSSTAKPTSQLISKSTKSTVGPKTTLKPSTAVKSVGKVKPPVTKTLQPEDVMKEKQDGTLVEIRDADSTTIEEVAYVSDNSQKCDENCNFKQESEVDEERVYAVAEQLIGVMQQLHKDSYVINMSGIEMEESSIQSLNGSKSSATPTDALEEELSDHQEETSPDVLAHQLPSETDTITEEEGMFETSELKIQGIAEEYFKTNDIFEETVKSENEHIEEYISNTDPQENCEAVTYNTSDQDTECLRPAAAEDEGAERSVELDMIEAGEDTIGQDFPNNEETNLVDESFPNSPEKIVCEDLFSNNEEETSLLEKSLISTSFNAETIENLSEISVRYAASILNDTEFENQSEPTLINAIELVEMNVTNTYIENKYNFESILENNNLPKAEENPSFIVDIPEDSAKDDAESFNSAADCCLSTLLHSVCENSSNNEVLPLKEIAEHFCRNMPEPALIDLANYNSEDIYANVIHESCNKEELSWSDLLLNSHNSGATDSVTAFTDLGIFNDEEQSSGSGPPVTDDKNENFMAFGNCEDVISMSYAEALVFPKTTDGNNLEVVEDLPHPVHVEEKILEDQINEVAVSLAESSIPIYSVYDIDAEFPDAVPSDEHYEKQDLEHEVDQHEETFHKIRHKRNKRRNKKNRKSSNSENFDEDSPNKVHTEKPNYQQPEYHGRRRNSRRWRNSQAYYEAFYQPQQAQFQEYYRDSHWKYSDAKMD